MNQEQYKKWISELPNLSVEQLTNLNSRIKLLFDVAVVERNGKADFGMRLLNALCSVLRKHRVETPSIHTLAKSPVYAASKAKIHDLADFFEGVSKSKLIQDAILAIGIGCLYDDMLSWTGTSISSHTLLRHVHRIPAALNKNYPGYAASGLLPKLVKGNNEFTN